MELLLSGAWIFLAIVVWIYADKLNRNSIGYTLLSCVISPVLVLLLLAILGNKDSTPPEENV
jgi:uncharacterized membrane protein YhaH (DUF805 family)